MKRLMDLVISTVVLFLIFSPLSSAFAQTKQVPITYPGDTEKTIARRAQWMERAKKEGGLVWWGTGSPKEKQGVIAEFNKVYPFIKVDHWRSQGAEMGAKLEQEYTAGRYTVDVLQGGEHFNYPRWRKIGLMVKFTDTIPGIGSIDKRMYSKYGDWAIPGNNATTPQFNTKLVSPAEAPKSWQDLLDPKWKGQIGVPAASIKQWAVLALAEGGWGMEKTEDFLRKLKEQAPKYGAGYSATHALLITGEFNIQAQGYLYHIFQSQKKGAPVNWSRVDPIMITGPAFLLNKNAPNPNAAHLFLEWLFSPQGLLLWDKITMNGAAFPGAGTMTSKALEGLNLIYRTEETELKTIETNAINRFSAILGVTPPEE